jgi:hypothetical protein
MEKKLTNTVEDRLLRAREESLRNHEDGTLRPLGKMWGMDVFTWINPYPGMVSNTIHSFPFPVVWIGNAADVLHTVNEDLSLCSNLHALVLTDASILELNGEIVKNVRNCAGTTSVLEAVEILKVFRSPQKVLLFTSSGEGATKYKEEFENYVKLVQGA